MAFLTRSFMTVFKTTPKAMDGSITLLSQNQVRFNNWPDWRMLKDHNKRQCVKQYGGERSRINSIRKCDLLPREIREIADKEIVDNVPRNSKAMRVVKRCAITSRPRGTVIKWRLSRIVFRHLADYNKLAGVIRAQW